MRIIKSLFLEVHKIPILTISYSTSGLLHQQFKKFAWKLGNSICICVGKGDSFPPYLFTHCRKQLKCIGTLYVIILYLQLGHACLFGFRILESYQFTAL